MSRFVKSVGLFMRQMIPAFALAIAMITDPTKWLVALGVMNDPHWVLPTGWRQSICFALLMIYLFNWFHRTRIAYEGDTIEREIARKLQDLRATGRAQALYEQERADIPKSDKDLHMGDHYENNGTVHGNMGPTHNHYGKQPFQMTQSVMEEVATHLGGLDEIEVDWIGTLQSRADMQKLGDFLEARGIKIRRGGGIGMLIPPLSTPIELRGNKLLVDSTK